MIENETEQNVEYQKKIKSMKFLFCFILYHPGFNSSLSDKKQRNGGISKISAILVKFALTGYRNGFYLINLTFLVRFCTNLPISERFWKCCHFFDFYRSVSCKNQDDKRIKQKKNMEYQEK